MFNTILLNILMPSVDFSSIHKKLSKIAKNNNLYYEYYAYDNEFVLGNTTFRINGSINSNYYNAILTLRNEEQLWDIINNSIEQ